MQIKKILQTIIYFSFLLHLLSCNNKENILPTHALSEENIKNNLVDYTDPLTYDDKNLYVLGIAKGMKLFAKPTDSLPSFVHDMEESRKESWTLNLQETDKGDYEL